ncbi:hypothetical protein EJ06DRAFT_133858 [Trichodelitschia bisporula]|uniref:Uncharacterized protein n=1 Tax=Trichodelitschia bisporula TaxID=703511 RepID=A0A6G1HPE3_9PEZI|nr:hypothetical protein EJ06DRAFT_133858 [Trichodelitschia bisporula]
MTSTCASSNAHDPRKVAAEVILAHERAPTHQHLFLSFTPHLRRRYYHNERYKNPQTHRAASPDVGTPPTKSVKSLRVSRLAIPPRAQPTPTWATFIARPPPP